VAVAACKFFGEMHSIAVTASVATCNYFATGIEGLRNSIYGLLDALEILRVRYKIG
jgi:hypothetical protein